MKDEINMFGKYVKQQRLAKRFTLRSFCLKHKLDPGNQSKLERGLLVPPSHIDGINKIAEMLKLDMYQGQNLKMFALDYHMRKLLSDLEIV